jgi:predicted nucleotidyltransferase
MLQQLQEMLPDVELTVGEDGALRANGEPVTGRLRPEEEVKEIIRQHGEQAFHAILKVLARGIRKKLGI